MGFVTANGIEMCVEEHGPASARPLLLIAGFSAQLVSWDPGFLDSLVDRGFRVITFDNRDAGLSHHFDGVDSRIGEILASTLNGDGDAPQPTGPYLLSDMAQDALGVLSAFDLESAHVVGASMGGMIAQMVAILAPDRVKTLTSIMSTTSEPEYSRPTPEAQAVLLREPAVGLEATIEGYIESGRIIGSKTHFDEVAVAGRATREYERGMYPEGTARQLAAILSSGDRAADLVTLNVPTLVIHGAQDPLIPLAGGIRTAELIPAAELLVLDDMGHDLPRPLWGEITGAIDRIATANP